MLEQIGIHTETAAITLEVRENEIVLRPAAAHPRAGWEESFAAMVANKEDSLVWPEGMVDAFDEGNRW
jgi:antitoxin component of MazEF toxin-antitoxin module